MYFKYKRGFTLIELLVVISIISLLSSVVLASLNSARAKSRDSIRKQNLVQLRNALQLYYLTNGSYPSTGGTWYSSEIGDNAPNNSGNWIPGLVSSGAISSLPKDPLGGASTVSSCSLWKRAYLYNSDGTNYKLLSHCAPEGTLSNPADTFYDPARPDHAWMVCSGDPTACAW